MVRRRPAIVPSDIERQTHGFAESTFVIFENLCWTASSAPFCVSVGCIFGSVLMLPDAHAGCARLAVLPGRLLLKRLRIAAHLCSRSLIRALRKATPTLEALIFGT